MPAPLILLSLLFGLAAVAAPTTIGLVNGNEVTGEFNRQTGGLFLRTDTGGRQYDWAEIDPMTLPTDLRRSLQSRLEDELQRAQDFYAAGQVEEAAPIFAKVLRHRHYLSINAVGSVAFQHVERKARAWVLHRGAWMPFAQRQQQLGLVRYNGSWVTAERARTAAVFNRAFAAARLRDDHAKSILELLALIRENPEAPEVAQAEALVNRLTAFLERQEAERKRREQQQAQQPVVIAPPPVQVVERVIERVPSSPFVYTSPWAGGGYRYANYGFNSYGFNSYNRGHGHGHRDRGDHHNNNGNSRPAIVRQPGFTFKTNTNQFNTGFPFAPPVSVNLTGSRVPQRASHGHSRRHTGHGHRHRDSGVNIHGNIGGLGIHVHRKDPIKIRF